MPRAPLQYPDDFHGREKEKERLIEQTKNKRSTAIIGPRSIGKSWLMQYLLLVAPTELGHNFRVGHLFATAAGCSTVDKFVRTALSTLNYVDSNLEQAELTLDTLDRAIKSLYSQSITPVLCIDEFEKFQEFGTEFISQLGASIGYGLVMIVICKERLHTYFGTNNLEFCEKFKPISLHSFTETEAIDFVEQKSAKANFTEEEKSRFENYARNKRKRIPVLLQDYGESIRLNRINTDQHDAIT
ncbi:MAG: AAA family ATPase [Ktedonobacteraceae bacterium]